MKRRRDLVLGIALALGLVLLVRAVLTGMGENSGGETGGVPMGTLPQNAGALSAMALGFVLLVSHFTGRVVTRIGLPAMSGYLLAGMVFGPYVLGALHPFLAVLDARAVGTLQLLDAVALGLIALNAGGELRWPSVRANARAIGGVLVMQAVLVVGGVLTGLWLLRGAFPALAGLPMPLAVSAAALCGVAALANSPATVLAVSQELRAAGPVADIVLAVTVAKDVVVIMIFTVVLSLSVALAGGGEMQAGGFLLLAWEVFGSIAVGVGLGLLVALYQSRLGRETGLAVLGLAFGAMTLLPQWHLSGLLALMTAGFVIENASSHGDDLIQAIERNAQPVFVVFFTIAGAGLNLPALMETWPLALFLAGLRLALTTVATTVGCLLAGAPPSTVRWGWSGFIAQAGVTLGFILLISRGMPALREVLVPVLLATVAINQLVGPVAYRMGLVLAGERGRADAPREDTPPPPAATGLPRPE